MPTPLDPRNLTEPAALPAGEPLIGKFVQVERLNPAEHASNLFDLTRQSPDLWRYLAQMPPASLDEFQERLVAQAKSEDPLFYSFLDPANKSCLGIAAYLRIEPKNRCIEVGHILFSPALQRTTAGTEAMFLMAQHAFEELGYRRYEWKCNALNEPSKRAAERFGFSYEGTFRQHMIVKGENRDTAWFAMLDHEWPARKRAFERWFDPANFDASGEQKRSLREFMQAGK